MAFRYINPGYSTLFESGNSATQAFGNEYSKTGVSFYCESFKEINVITETLGTDLYCRFDVYYQRYSVDLNCNSSYSPRYTHGIYGYKGQLQLYYLGNPLGDALQLEKNLINKIWLHWHFSGCADTSYGELKVNGATSYVSLAGRDYYGFAMTPTPIKISLHDKGNYFSNIIISDEYISPKENVVILPTLKTETNMTTSERGIYVANATNQTLLQSVDVAELIETYDASAVITGIQLVGNPAYKIGGGSAALVGLIKNDANIIEHGTFSLSSDTNAGIYDGWSIESLPIAELNSMQFGWKVGV